MREVFEDLDVNIFINNILKLKQYKRLDNQQPSFKGTRRRLNDYNRYYLNLGKWYSLISIEIQSLLYAR